MCAALLRDVVVVKQFTCISLPAVSVQVELTNSTLKTKLELLCFVNPIQAKLMSFSVPLLSIV
jgi:hypothetical protein